MNLPKSSLPLPEQPVTNSSAARSPEQVLGDPATWLSEHGDYLYRYAFMQLKDSATAEDVVQETFLSAYRARLQFEGKSSLRTWLMSILRNKVIDIIRKKKREQIVEGGSIDTDPIIREQFSRLGIWKRWLNSWESSPEKLVEQQEFMTQLSRCLSSLPENLRQVFILKNVDDLTTEEICAKLEISPNNVWVILYRARLRLRECLDKNWFHPGE